MLALATGCYASHDRFGATPDAGPVDSTFVRPDAAEPDAAEPDAGRPDTAVMPTFCERDADCAGALCVLDTSVAPRDGDRVPLVCGGAGATSPGVECDDNAACENGLCALAGGCVEPCVDDFDCRPDERCTEVPIVTGPRALQTARACARWVDAPPSVTVAEDAPLPVMSFTSQLFSLPRSGASRRLVMHVANSIDPFRTIDRVSLSGSGGGLLHDIGDLGRRPQINPAVAYWDVAPILIPNAPWPASLDPHAPLAYAISHASESQVQRIVLEHEGHGTTLDLDVFFVGIRRDARSRRGLDQMLDGYGAILESLGLRLGRVREHVAEGSAATAFSVLDDENEVGELFRWSAGAARPTVSVFLVASSSLFVGIAGGVPGAQLVHGTRSSGVAVCLEDLLAALDAGLPAGYASVVLAHELGHFMGLFHTTEADGTTFEPLTDTPLCTIDHDTNGDGMVLGDECVSLDGENVMFWASASPRATFSPSQQDVVRGAPVLLP